MATFTLLISVPDDEAPSLARDFAEDVQRGLEERGYTVATVDGLRGDHLKPSASSTLVRTAHRLVAGEQYTGL